MLARIAFGIAGAGITDSCAVPSEPCDGICHVLDVQPIMGETCRPLRVRLPELKERVFADVHVDQPRLPVVVVETERFPVAPLSRCSMSSHPGCPAR